MCELKDRAMKNTRMKLSQLSMHRRGFTLLEVLIATAVALFLMLGLSQVFKVLGDSITKGRAGLELNNRLRNVAMRIRSDLDTLTVASGYAGPLAPPAAPTIDGYLKFYDGPMNDFTLGAVDATDTNPGDGIGPPSASPNPSNPLLNRMGDMDDIFMATVQATGSWFTGKVPRFILEKRLPTAATMVDVNPSNGIPDEFDDLVTISSQFAQVIIFALPQPASANNPTRDVGLGIAANPSSGTYEDAFSGINATTDSVPDTFRLHYRVLLIRDDLNLPSGLLPAYAGTTPAQRAMIAGPEDLFPFVPAANNVSLPSPVCDMYRINQFCDLSVNRVYNTGDGLAGSLDYVSASSIGDLRQPQNRFAHVIHQIGGAASQVWSMPVLALGSAFPFQPINDTNFVAKSGFLHPTYSLLGDRRGEDILATDLIGFDIKAFDPGCPLIYDPPPSPGSGLVVRPADPGFLDVGIRSLTATKQPIAFGDFVDLSWGDSLKLPISTAVTALQAGYLESPISGADIVAGSRVMEPTLTLSGGFVSTNPATGGTLIYQPAYDTYTTSYANDNIAQGPLLPAPGVGTLQWFGPSPPIPVDRGTNNQDDDADILVDEVDEQETSPPFVENLRGLQISVRLEDRATKQFKQMSITKSFVLP
jgi:prepilin-type N-terminal cleavage/methylation domain-containing protein